MKNIPNNLYAMLNLPIVELPFTENFKLRAKLMGFFCLNDIIHSDVSKLHERPDYTEHWYMEFARFMNKHGLSFLIN